MKPITLTVQVGSVQQSNGTYSPSITVIRHQNHKWSPVLFSLPMKHEFTAAEEAITFGKESAIEALRVSHPAAEIDLR